MAGDVDVFVLSGGVGSRLWPVSRSNNPKQLNPAFGTQSMLVDTLKRFDRDGFGATQVIASANHAAKISITAEDCGVGADHCWFEPVGRNTAAAAALAAQIKLAAGDGYILLTPCDQMVSPQTAFEWSIQAGVTEADSGALVLFGVRPTAPETEFGYIFAPDGATVRDVELFAEKPDLAMATRWLEGGNHFWNSGMILCLASSLQREFLLHAPTIWEGVARAREGLERDWRGNFLQKECYLSIPSEPVDTAILECTSRAKMIVADFEWNDIGSWKALHKVGAKDDSDNVLEGDVLAFDCLGSLIVNEGPLVAAVGMQGISIVSTPDAVFVAPIERSHEVVQVVDALRRRHRLEAEHAPDQTVKQVQTNTNQERVTDWLCSKALPLWGKAGADWKCGGFHEVLDFSCRSTGARKRLRTMARQTLCFAQAEHLGFYKPETSLVEHGLRWLTQMQGIGFPRVVDIEGSVMNGTVELYDQSFVLMACAAALEAGHVAAKPIGLAVLRQLSNEFTDRRNGAFHEFLAQESVVRRANPHMHLLEALLAWNRVTGNGDVLDLCDGLVALFKDKFLDQENWVVIERFGWNFSRLDGAGANRTVPGHQFEWARLLCEHAEVSGLETPDEARKIYTTALGHGLNGRNGLAWASVNRWGFPTETLHRSWPQAEALHCAISLTQNGVIDGDHQIEKMVERLFKYHLDNAPDGLWMDGVDEDGNAIAMDVPASIFYHLMGALSAYLQYCDKRVKEVSPAPRTACR